MQTAPALRFDVASVKPSNEPFISVRFQRPGGRITWTTDLRYLIEYAYGLQLWRISGPVPGSNFAYTIDAITSPNATDDQVRQMFQSLLRDRFKMAAHRVNKDVQGYALTVAKGGPNMLEAKQDGPLPPLPEGFRGGTDPARMEGFVTATVPREGVTRVAGRRVTMLQLSERLQTVLQGAVLDMTGLSGKYYFAFEFAQEDGAVAGEVPLLASAIKELGLKLEKHRGPVEMLVVDRIESTPTEN